MQHKLQEIKTIEYNQHYNKDEDMKGVLLGRLTNLNLELKGMTENYEFAKKQIVRIQKIVGICRENTQQNEDWIRVGVM